jgi:bisanhydrobacterioruberin hydratase
MKQYTAKIAGHLTKAELKMSVLVCIVYAVGIAGMAISFTTDLFISLIPAVIILSLAASLAFHRQPYDTRTVILFSAIVLLSWLIEAAGVATGIIFGEYTYGPSLGLKLFETPLLIGVNWLLLIYGSAVIAEFFPLNQAGKILSASILMVVYDLILEIAAPALGMWQFEGGTAPLRNYISWFLVAVLFHTVLRLSGVKIVNRVAPVVFVIQFIFFLALILIIDFAK